MLGYGIGRIGCHLAGDGDWGIMADMSLKPDWLPMWLWAETYPNNILGMNIPEPVSIRLQSTSS
jgi:phosphatidylglycerol---prolipoprotein diacylglyceryl transferase